MNYTSGNLKKLEVLLKEMGYGLRYEKGNFNSGYCILQDKNIAIVNKYFTEDVKFQKVMDIILSIEQFDLQNLSEGSLKILEKINPQKRNPNPIPFDEDIQ